MHFLSYVSVISIVRTAKIKTFPRCCRNEMSYKTKTGEDVTGETDEFLLYLSVVAIVLSA